MLRHTLNVLKPTLRQGIPVVVLEPSCAAVFRSDMPELLHGDEDAHRLAALTRTLGEILRERARNWSPPRMKRRQSCNRTAISTPSSAWTPTRRSWPRAASTPTCWTPDAAGWQVISASNRAITTCPSHAQKTSSCLAIRGADADTVVVADGFSCRTQIGELTGDRVAVHTARHWQPRYRAIDGERHGPATWRGRRMAAALAVVALVGASGFAVARRNGRMVGR